MRLVSRVVVAVSVILAGCDKSGNSAGPPPDHRGARPPSASADAAGAKPSACKDGGGQVSDATAAAFFPRVAGGYCVNPDGETKAFGDKAPKPMNGICGVFDGGCELYMQNQVKRLVGIDYVEAAGKGGQIEANLSQYADAEHAYAMFTHRVTSDEDPARTDVPKSIDVGATAAIGTGALYAWKGTYLLELAYTNSSESGDDKILRASGEKALPPLAKEIVGKLPGDSALPVAVQKLPKENLVPLGVTYVLANALGADGTGGGAVGYYKDGDKRWRILAIPKADADQAKDVVKSFAKKKGATEEKAIGDGAVRLMVQEAPDGPKAEWVIARQGPLAIGIGDESYAIADGASAGDHDKVCLSKDDKVKKLRAILAAK